ncbi:MAG: LVIVD repeat-containing protein, partial [Promethearchaeota archaeon]
VQMVPVGTSFYFEDFTNNSLEDALVSDAPGWGTGVVTNQRQLSISQLDFYSTTPPIVDVAVQGRKVYATGLNNTGWFYSVFCFNITDPNNIEYMSHRNSVNGLLTGDVDGDIYYNGGNSGGGWIGLYNVSNPYHLGGAAFIISIATDGPVTDVEAQGRFLYGTVYQSASSQGLAVVDVTDPTAPFRIPNTITFDEALGLDVVGDLAYVADGTHGIFVMNVSNPNNIPGAIGSVNTPGNATDILVDGFLGIVADGPAGVHFVNLIDPTNPTIIGTIDTPGEARRLALQGNTLFVADGAGGVSIIDLRHPYYPQVVAEIALPYTWDVDLYGGILVVGTDDGIYTYQTGLGLTGLPVVGSYAGGFNYWDVVVRGNVAYVAANESVLFFNVQDPADPVLLNNTYVPGAFFRRVELDGDYLYAMDYNSGLYIFDASDPANPILVHNWGGAGALDVDVVSGVAYIAAGPAWGIQIFNMSNVRTPIFITQILGVGNVTTVQAQGPHLYFASDIGGAGVCFYIYDISTISAPVQLSAAFTTGLFYDIFVDGDVIYSADTNWPIVWNATNPYNAFFNGASGWLFGNQTYAAAGFGAYMLSNDHHLGLTVIDARNINVISYLSNQPAVTDIMQIEVYGDYAFIATHDSLDVVHLYRSAAGTYQVGTDISQSLQVSTTTELIVNATLDFGAYVLTGTSITFALSADGGMHWETVTPGVEHVFMYPGYDLRWAANLSTSHPDQSVHLYEVTITYDHTVVGPGPFPPELLIALIAAIIIIIVIIIVVMLLRRRKSGER